MGCGTSTVVKSKHILSLPIDRLKDEYEVVCIGSGYGGSVAASRAARLGLKVCLLEKGKEWPIGSFPETELEAVKEFQIDGLNLNSSLSSTGTGLYNITTNKEIVIVHGCGLGGGSLINAGVNLQPRDKVFEEKEWPRHFREEWRKTKFKDDFQRANDMLRSAC